MWSSPLFELHAFQRLHQKGRGRTPGLSYQMPSRIGQHDDPHFPTRWCPGIYSSVPLHWSDDGPSSGTAYSDAQVQFSGMHWEANPSSIRLQNWYSCQECWWPKYPAPWHIPHQCYPPQHLHGQSPSVPVLPQSSLYSPGFPNAKGCSEKAEWCEEHPRMEDREKIESLYPFPVPAFLAHWDEYLRLWEHGTWIAKLEKIGIKMTNDSFTHQEKKKYKHQLWGFRKQSKFWLKSVTWTLIGTSTFSLGIQITNDSFTHQDFFARKYKRNYQDRENFLMKGMSSSKEDISWIKWKK